MDDASHPLNASKAVTKGVVAPPLATGKANDSTLMPQPSAADNGWTYDDALSMVSEVSSEARLYSKQPIETLNHVAGSSSTQL